MANVSIWLEGISVDAQELDLKVSTVSLSLQPIFKKFISLLQYILFQYFLGETDIDECQVDHIDCGGRGYCINTRGSYK